MENFRGPGEIFSGGYASSREKASAVPACEAFCPAREAPKRRRRGNPLRMPSSRTRSMGLSAPCAGLSARCARLSARCARLSHPARKAFRPTRKAPKPQPRGFTLHARGCPTRPAGQFARPARLPNPVNGAFRSVRKVVPPGPQGDLPGQQGSQTPTARLYARCAGFSGRAAKHFAPHATLQKPLPVSPKRIPAPDRSPPTSTLARHKAGRRSIQRPKAV